MEINTENEAKLKEISQNKQKHEEGPMFALQMAHEAMKKKLRKMEHEKFELEKDLRELVHHKV